MSKRCWSVLVVLLVSLPSLVYCLGLEGMGGMGMGMGMGDGPGIVDQVQIQTPTVGKVVFSHSRHGTNCGACHPQLFENKANSRHATMAQMENGKSCGGCHNGKKAFSVKGNCEKCHAGDILYKEKTTGDITFSHTNHVGSLGGCDSCHPSVFKAQRGANKATMEQMEKGKSCGACHDGKNAFGVADACDSCHKS